VIFLPLEIFFNILEKTSAVVAQFLVGGDSMSIKGLNFIKPITKPIISASKDLISSMGLESNMVGALMITLGIGLIFFAITFIGKLLKELMVGKAKQILHSTIGRGPISGITSGTIVTVLVQSSSTTTSLMVPLVGSGVFKVRDIYPFTLGANIGTCITALLAATAVSGENAVFAMQIAIVHLIYNVTGVIVIYGIPFLRNIPLIMADKLATASSEKKLYAVSYIVGVFFIVPGLLVFASN
jgi:sodium-dependent phosphate cotransporter